MAAIEHLLAMLSMEQPPLGECANNWPRSGAVHFPSMTNNIGIKPQGPYEDSLEGIRIALLLHLFRRRGGHQAAVLFPKRQKTNELCGEPLAPFAGRAATLLLHCAG